MCVKLSCGEPWALTAKRSDFELAFQAKVIMRVFLLAAHCLLHSCLIS
jgi:hypothetical protein